MQYLVIISEHFPTKMDALIKEFRTAYTKERGNDLAKTLTPDLSDSTKLLSILESGRNAQAIKDDLQFLFVRDKSAQLRMSRDEAQGWQEVYLAYWKALGEILAAEGRRRDGARVCAFQILHERTNGPHRQNSSNH